MFFTIIFLKVVLINKKKVIKREKKFTTFFTFLYLNFIFVLVQMN